MPLQATINAKDVDVQCDCDGSTFDLSHKLFAARHPEASAGVIRLVAAAMKDWNSPRHSPTPVRQGSRYLAFTSPSCSAVMGEWHLSENAWRHRPQRTANLRMGAQARPHSQWYGKLAQDVVQ